MGWKNMSLKHLKDRGLLPRTETPENLTVKMIFDKIASFYARYEQCLDGDISDCAESFFLRLLLAYPESTCSNKMSDNIKLLIALIYYEHEGSYSVEDLSTLFDRSKSTIHAAIHDKEVEAKATLKQAPLRLKAREIALEEMIQEEKLHLLEMKERNENKQTNECPEP